MLLWGVFIAALVAPPSLVVEAQAGRTLAIATADGRASVRARDVALTVVISPGDEARIVPMLLPYDAQTRWTRIAPRSRPDATIAADPAILDPRNVQFELVVARPEPLRFAAFVDHLESRLVRARTSARLWSIVDGVDDCAALDSAAIEAARTAAERTARALATAMHRRIASALATADATENHTLDDGTRRCDLGRIRVPARRADIFALTDPGAIATSVSRVATVFSTLADTAGATSPDASTNALPRATSSSDDADEIAPRVLAIASAVRLRVDETRLGATITTIGTSARVRRPTSIRYSWASERGRVDGARTLDTLVAAERRLTTLGISRAQIRARVRSGPTYPVDLLVDVPQSLHLAAATVVHAIAGDSLAIAAAIGETFVRDDCETLDFGDARDALASARQRATGTARELGAVVGAPLAIHALAMRATPCAFPRDQTRGIVRGTLVAGPERKPAIATYTAVAVTFALDRPIVVAQRLATARASSSRAPAAFFLSPAARELPPIDIATRGAAIVVEGVGTAHAPAHRTSFDLVIAPDAAHHFAPVDARRAYALVAPLERAGARTPTRIVLRPLRAGSGSELALHLELPGAAATRERSAFDAILRDARALGSARMQLAVTGAPGAGEVAALRAAIDAALRAARDEARARRTTLGPIVAILDATAFVDRVASLPRVGVTTRVRLVFAKAR